jgi:uncharacterized membrane protein YidH (DUF202 family)
VTPDGHHVAGGADGRLDLGSAERVEFAWHRTGLALAGIGLAVARRALPHVRARPAVGAVLIGVGVLAAIGATVFRLTMQRRPAGRRTHLRRATSAVLALGVLSFVIAGGTV